MATTITSRKVLESTDPAWAFENGATYTCVSGDVNGGALYNKGTTVTGSNVTFKNNSVDRGGGGAICNKGTINFTGTSVTFSGNSAVGNGGAIYITKGTGSGTINFAASVTFSGNQTTSGVGGAIYSIGSTINLTNTVTLGSETDTWVNRGYFASSLENYSIVNWNLSNVTDPDQSTVCINGFQWYSNMATAVSGTQKVLVNQNITVNAAQASGSYVIATGDFDMTTLNTNNSTNFTVTDGANNAAITVGGTIGSIGTKGYKLALVESETAGADQLVLTVAELPGVSVDDSFVGKWFKAGETITVTGTYTGEDITSFKFGSNDITDIDPQAKTWSYTFASPDTTGTEYDISITTALSSATTKYTLKVDTVAPDVTETHTEADYKDSQSQINWYKRVDSKTASLTLTAEDATSGVDYIFVKDYGAIFHAYSDNTYTYTLDLSTEVRKTISYFASDKAGNNAEVQEFNYGVDGTGPEVSDVAVSNSYETEEGAYWVKLGADVTVSATVIDSESGVKEVKFEDQTVSAKGTSYSADYDTSAERALTEYCIHAEDNVGNSSHPKFNIGVDGTEPTFTDPVITGGNAYKVSDGTYWVKQGETVTAATEVSDEKSGVDASTVTFDGAAYVSGSVAVIVTTAEAGLTDHTFAASDNVGNAATKSVKVGVDGTGPSIGEASITGTNVYQNWIKSGTAFTVTTKIEDAKSGLKEAVLEGATYANGKFELTAGADGALADHTIIATDNVINQSIATVNYGFDGRGPVIGAVSADSFSGTTKYIDGSGNIWFKKDDTTAALTVDIEDDKSGLKEAQYAGIAYADGKFKLATDVETGISTAITATDNVGNESQSASIAYNVDGTGPSITVTHVPPTEYVASVDVTAVITDDGSGVKTQQYSFNGGDWTDYTGTFTVTENGTVTFKAVDNVGNETVETHTITNIDTVPPVVTIDAETVKVQESVTFTVTAVDDYTNVIKVEYSIDGGTSWTECTIEQGKKSVTVTQTADVNNTTYLFRAYDQAKNVCDPVSVTFNNIYKGTEESFEIIGEKVVTSERPMDSETITMSKNSSLKVEENSSVSAGNLVLLGNTALVNNGTVEADTMVVNDKNNVIAGDTVSVGSITLIGASELGLDKEQYENFMALSAFTADSNGKMIVSSVIGNALRTDDIDTLMNKENVADVEFKQDLIDVNKLNIKNTKSVKIGFENAYGTTGSDTIRFYKDTDVTFGAAGKEINLEEGSNTVQIDKNADVTVLSDLTNVSTVKSASGSEIAFADIDFQSGRSASLKAEGSYFKADEITGSDKATTITVGKNSTFESGKILFGNKSDKITTSAGSKMTVTDVDFGEGKDTLTTGKSSEFTADSIAGAETVTFGEYGSAEVGSISGVKDLKVRNGSKSDSAELTVKAVVGTEGNDTFYVGSYNEVELDSLAFGDGNDKLTVCKNASLEVSELDFGTGKDQIAIDSCSKDNEGEVILKAASAESITKFTIGAYADVYLSSELYGAVTKANKNAKVYDIGEFDVAKVFTSYAEENLDNTFDGAQTLESADYEGWLCGVKDLDEIDCFAWDDWTQVSNVAGSGLNIRQLDADGTQIGDITAFTGNITKAETAAYFEITLADTENKAMSYKLNVAQVPA